MKETCAEIIWKMVLTIVPLVTVKSSVNKSNDYLYFITGCIYVEHIFIYNSHTYKHFSFKRHW